jgi:hypothetical protein
MAEEKIQRRPYGPPNVDGFPDGEENSVAYCPREKKKKDPSEHRSCEHNRTDLVSAEESRDAAACAFDDSEESEEEKRSRRSRRRS